ncbi:MAG: hypothetical protein ABIQ88_18480 [Chitinophagaceae bacterium]
MELEEMKARWTEMSATIEKQKQITDTLIIKMTQVNYRNRLSKILIPELAGTLVSFAYCIYIIINFHKLTSWYMVVCAVIGLIILMVLPVMSLKAIYNMKSVNIAGSNYKQALLQYAKGKRQFIFVQKLSLYTGAILMLVLLPVMCQLLAGKDLFKMVKLWMWYAIAFPFFMIFAKWVYGYYMKTTRQMDSLLQELEE